MVCFIERTISGGEAASFLREIVFLHHYLTRGGLTVAITKLVVSSTITKIGVSRTINADTTITFAPPEGRTRYVC